MSALTDSLKGGGPGGSSIIVECPGCKTKVKLPAAPRVRCPTCKREFTPLELQRAVLGERLGVPQDEPMLEEEPDEDDEDDSSDPDAPDPDDDSEESDDSEP